MIEERYSKMLAITTQTKEYIKKFFSLEELESQVCRETVWDFYSKRYEKKIWLRPYLTATFYEHFAGEPFQEIIPFLAVSEVFNVSTYQSNLVFDNKISPQPINLEGMNNFIASFISYNLANKITLKTSINAGTKVKILDLLNDCNKKIYEGQSIDLNVLICDNISWLLNDEPAFYSLYEKRCELIAGASVMYCTQSAAILSNNENDNSLMECLVQLSNQWGSMMQIINDLSDYVFINNTNERYFDVRADKLTLPLYLIMKQIGLQQSEDFINSLKNMNEKQLEDFFQLYLYVDSPIVKEIFGLLRNKWGKCKEYMNQLQLEKEFSLGLFESAFLNKFSRRLFSNSLIKQLKVA